MTTHLAHPDTYIAYWYDKTSSDEPRWIVSLEEPVRSGGNRHEGSTSSTTLTVLPPDATVQDAHRTAQRMATARGITRVVED